MLPGDKPTGNYLPAAVYGAKCLETRLECLDTCVCQANTRLPGTYTGLAGKLVGKLVGKLTGKLCAGAQNTGKRRGFNCYLVGKLVGKLPTR